MPFATARGAHFPINFRISSLYSSNLYENEKTIHETLENTGRDRISSICVTVRVAVLVDQGRFGWKQHANSIRVMSGEEISERSGFRGSSINIVSLRGGEQEAKNSSECRQQLSRRNDTPKKE